MIVCSLVELLLATSAKNKGSENKPNQIQIYPNGSPLGMSILDEPLGTVQMQLDEGLSGSDESTTRSSIRSIDEEPVQPVIEQVAIVHCVPGADRASCLANSIAEQRAHVEQILDQEREQIEFVITRLPPLREG